jgi:hypothetical protein
MLSHDPFHKAPSSLTARSRVTNGKIFKDGRSAGARRFRDLMVQFADEAGGMVSLSASGQQLVRRLAQVSLELELMEASRAAGNAIDPLAYVTLVNSQQRLLRDLRRLAPRRALTPA